MLDIKVLRNDPETVKENIRKKFQDQKLALVDEVVELDRRYRESKLRGDTLRGQRNTLSKQIGGLLTKGKVVPQALPKHRGLLPLPGHPRPDPGVLLRGSGRPEGPQHRRRGLVPRRKKHFEVGSCFNLGDAQSRRLGIRIQGSEGNCFAHTLNNTVVAPPRMLITFLENNLNADGSVRIPQPLRMYMGGKDAIR